MKRGFLLMNTGSPDSPAEADVRRYLGEFLMDPHVVDLPWILRALLVKGIVLPRRTARSAAAYRAVWTDGGSPLVGCCIRLARALEERLGEPVEPAMAYGNPPVAAAVAALLAKGVGEIHLLPLFPQHAMATTAACTARVRAELRRRKRPAVLRVAPPFYREPAFVRPLADALEKDVGGHVLFSYHGLPERHLRKADPTGRHCLSTPDCCREPSPAHATCYRHQCLETTRAVAAAAGLPAEHVHVAFQSRLGRAKWMAPHTAQVLAALPAQGVVRLAVICPAFFCDCLETIEEIGLRGRQAFLGAGGESFRLVPCLNDSPGALRCLEALARGADGWPGA